jgi:hypothetical protein
MSEQAETFSVSIRVQRTTTEEAFVSVPVTPDLIVTQPDGTGRIDTGKLFSRAVEMGHESSVVWQTETQEVQLHPIQVPPPSASLLAAFAASAG